MMKRQAAAWLAGVAAFAFGALPAAAAFNTGSAPSPARSDAPHYMQVADLFGESDEEKAARLAAQQREQAQDASIANLNQQVDELEHSLRRLTGQLEEARHENELLGQKIERMKHDFDYRLCQMAAQQLGEHGGDSGIDCGAASGAASAPAPGQQGSLPSSTQTAAAASPGMPGTMSAGSGVDAAGQPNRLGRPSGTLGTLPQGTPMPQPTHTSSQDVTVDMGAVHGGNGAQPASAGDGGSANRGEFDTAMNLLAKAQYNEARVAFRGFADSHPKDDLAPQAVYWVGSIAYVQKDYAGAARAFAEEIKNYPDAPRAPESMLKLGQALIAMKQKDQGCTTLAALKSKYPKASATVRREAAKARRESCR